MGAPKRWALTDKIDFLLVILNDDGSMLTSFSISHFSSYFALNELPQATCLIAVGKPTRVDQFQITPNSKPVKPDLFSKTAGQLKAMQKVKVYGTFSGDYDVTGKKWPNGAKTMFDGRLLGFSYQKINGQIFVSIQLIHWLVDLANTTLLSQYVHPSGSANLAFPLSRLAPGGGGAAMQPLTVGDVGPGFLDLPQVTTDVWGALKDFFYVYAGSLPMEFQGDFAAANLNAPAKNDLAKAALARIEGGLGLSAETKPARVPYLFGAPGSPLQTTVPASDLAVAGAIRETIRNKINQIYGAGTLWDHLVGEISPMFDLHVVPLIDSALVVPVTPGLRFTPEQKPWRTLAVDDYFAENVQAALHYPIKAVVVTNSQGRMQTDANIAKVSFNGVFQPQDIPEAKNGAILFLQAPSWLQYIEGSAARNFAPGNVQNGNVINGAEVPQKPAQGNADAKRRADLAKSQFDYLNRFAQSMYVQRALAGRVATISGRLRFDIAPGATIKLEGSSELFTDKKQDALAQDAYGLVVRTSISIDAEAAQAATTYQLSHMRSVSETQSGYCMDTHPLYNVRFLGAPMSADYNI